MARKKRFKTPRITTVIGKEVSIEGNLFFSGGLHLDGTIHGNVCADQDDSSTLILSDQGRVEGDVQVPNVILNGEVKGDVYASQRVELIANARVTGSLYYKLLEMAMGAEVNGRLVSGEGTPPPKLAYQGGSEEESQASEERGEDAVKVRESG